MIGMNLKITMLDGESHEHPITYGAACAWEDAHPGLSPQQFLKDIKFKQLARLAYEVLRKNNVTVKVWPQFIDTIADVEFVPKEQKEQQATTST